MKFVFGNFLVSLPLLGAAISDAIPGVSMMHTNYELHSSDELESEDRNVPISNVGHKGIMFNNTAYAEKPVQARTFVFLCPPASFAQYQIGIALELARRGNHVLILSLPPFRRHLNAQIDETEYAGSLDLWEIAGEWAQQWTSTERMGDMLDVLKTTRSDHKRPGLISKWGLSKHPGALQEPATAVWQFYTAGFAGITDVVDAALDAVEQCASRKQCESLKDPFFTPAVLKRLHLITEKRSELLVVLPFNLNFPVAWAVRHGFAFVTSLPSAQLLEFVPQPLGSSPRGRYLHGGPKNLQDRLQGLWQTLLSWRGGDPYFREARKHPVLNFIFAAPFMVELRELPPSTILVGPVISPGRRHKRHLTAPMQKLFSKNIPVIYISLGSYAQFTGTVLEKIVNALIKPCSQSASCGVIWALAKSQHQEIPKAALDIIKHAGDSVVLDNWVQTPAVLAHPLTKLFVSHCGMNGLGEGAASGVPILGLPLFGDQPGNCRASEQNLGFVKCLSLNSDSEGFITETAMRILNGSDLRIKEAALVAANVINSMYRGAPYAAEWLETAHDVRGNFSFFRTPIEEQGHFKGHCADVIFASFVIVLILLLLLTAFVRRILKMVHRRSSRRNTEQKKDL